MALRHLRQERDSHTLQRTALVHEAFLAWSTSAGRLAKPRAVLRHRFADDAPHPGGSRAAQSAKKRGDRAPARRPRRGSCRRKATTRRRRRRKPKIDFEAVDAALRKLEVLDAQQGKLVELRFFGGLSHRGNRRGHRRLLRDGEARVGDGARVAAARAQAGEAA